MPVILRRHTAEHIFGVIAPLENHCHFARRTQRFRKSGPWLLSESYLNRVLLAPEKYHDAFPGLKLGSTRVGRGVLLWRRCVGRSIETCSAADAVRVKSNLRSFYVDQKQGVAAKLILDHDLKRIEGIRNEVNTRSRLQASGGLRIPPILAHHLDDPSPWYTEQLISGRTACAGDAPVIASELLPGLMSMYRNFGVTWKAWPATRGEEFCRRVELAMRRLKWRKHWMPPEAFLNKIRELQADDARIPFAMCHGDLSPTNIIITPRDEAYLIDWETADVRPVMHDLCGLMLHFGLTHETVYSAVAQLANGGNGGRIMPPAFQHALALLFRIVFWQRQVERGTRVRQGTVSSELQRLFDEANLLLENGTSRSASRQR